MSGPCVSGSFDDLLAENDRLSCRYHWHFCNNEHDTYESQVKVENGNLVRWTYLCVLLCSQIINLHSMRNTHKITMITTTQL
jgi:hypothetical protein